MIDADRLHAAAHALARRRRALLAALDAAWCGGKPAAPPYACAWLDADEVSDGGGGGRRRRLGRSWVVDLRPSADFDRSHFALTLSLPPSEARSADARRASARGLMDICREGGCGVTFLTPDDPMAATGGLSEGHLTVEETRTVVHEFIRDGFRHVGIVRGGFAALSPEQRKALISDGFTPDADGAQRASKGRLSMSRVLGGVSSLARGSSALMKRAKATPM